MIDLDRQTGSNREGRHLHSLDFIRGLAALVVLVYHVDFMFGLRGELLKGGYLAVDLFFVLSGFVLSLNYGARIREGAVTFSSYILNRLARLYPLFLATTLVGVPVMTARFYANEGYLDTVALVQSWLANVFMLPSFAEPYGARPLFPFNPASWSIFFEMAASLAFFVVLARLSLRWLAAVAGLSALLLVAGCIGSGTVDWGWGTENVWIGFPRVFLSFTLGVIIHRRFAARPWCASPLALYSLLALTLALVQVRTWLPQGAAAGADLLAALVLLPLLVAVAAGVRFGEQMNRLSRILGEASYGVYLNQGVLVIIAAGLAQGVIGVNISDLGAWVGFVFVPIVFLSSLGTYHILENPARGWARRRIKGWSGERVVVGKHGKAPLPAAVSKGR